MKRHFPLVAGFINLAFAHSLAFAQFAPTPLAAPARAGEVKGSAVQHTLASAEG